MTDVTLIIKCCVKKIIRNNPESAIATLRIIDESNFIPMFVNRLINVLQI